MPAYKEFAIMIKRAGIKFVVVLVKVEDQPETQLMRSLRANLTRHNIGTYIFCIFIQNHCVITIFITI